MKKIFALLLSICLIFVLFSGCAVNSSTGLIALMNLADKDVTIKIGDTSIFLGKGLQYDHWFTAELKVRISAKEADNVIFDNNILRSVKDEDGIFKLGYVYQVKFVKRNDKYYVNVERGYATGKDLVLNNDSTHSPYGDIVIPD